MIPARGRAAPVSPCLQGFRDARPAGTLTSPGKPFQTENMRP